MLVAEVNKYRVNIDVQLVETEYELIDEYAFSKKLHLRLPGDVVLLQSQLQVGQLFRKKKSCCSDVADIVILENQSQVSQLGQVGFPK